MKPKNQAPTEPALASELSRRTLLKTGLLGLSSLALGPSLVWNPALGETGRGLGEYVSLFTGRVGQGIPTTCGLCPAGCGVLAFRDQGRLAGLSGNPDHPYNRGALCALGSAVFNLESGPRRIQEPVRRRGKRGDGEWEVITWTEALQEVQGKLRKCRDARGKTPLAVSVPGRDATPFMHRFVSCFPGSVLNEADGYEDSVERVLRRDFWCNGEGIPDLAHAQLVLNFGGNPLGSIQRLVGTAQQWARGLEHGARWITLDPRLSETANAGHEWVPLRPGTDRAVAAAVARHILEQGMEDRRFLKQETDLDPADLRRAFQPWTARRAAALCQVPEETIHRVAEAFAKTDRAVAVLGSGVTARRGGLESARAVLLLNLLKGNIQQKGGYRIQPSVSWQQPGPAPCSRDVRRLHGSLFHAMEKGTLKPGCLMTCHADPAATDPACGSTEDILKDPERVPFHVAVCSTWNQTASLADIVLPVSTYLNAWGVTQGFSASDGSLWIGLRQPVFSGAGERCSSEEVLLEIARGLGRKPEEAFPFESMEAYYTSLIEASFPGGDRVNLSVALKKRGFFTPAVSGGAGFAGRGDMDSLKQGKHASPVEARTGMSGSGPCGRQRILLSNRVGNITAPLKAPEIEVRARAEERILVLYSAPTVGDESPGCPWVEEINHAAPVWMNPEAAAEMGCREGDWVVLKGPAGEVKTRVRLTEGIRPDVVAVQARTGGVLRAPGKGRDSGRAADPLLRDIWWKGGSYGENPRRVIPWPGDPSREVPSWEGTKVKIRRA